MKEFSPQISWSDLKAGDILNKAGSHVRLFHYYHSGGSIILYESKASGSIGGMTHRVLAHDNSYIPRRYQQVRESLRQPAPEITFVYPNPMTTKTAGQRQWLILFGKNFEENGKLNFKMIGFTDFNNRQPLFLDAQTLAYAINVGNTAAPWQVQVINTDKQTSNSMRFQVKNP